MTISSQFILAQYRCKKFISDLLEYMLSNGQVKIPDFEISHFTRAGKYLNILI